MTQRIAHYLYEGGREGGVLSPPSPTDLSYEIGPVYLQLTSQQGSSRAGVKGNENCAIFLIS